MSRILLIDDDPGVRDSMEAAAILAAPVSLGALNAAVQAATRVETVSRQ